MRKLLIGDDEVAKFNEALAGLQGAVESELYHSKKVEEYRVAVEHYRLRVAHAKASLIAAINTVAPDLTLRLPDAHGPRAIRLTADEEVSAQ